MTARLVAVTVAAVVGASTSWAVSSATGSRVTASSHGAAGTNLVERLTIPRRSR